MDGRVSEQRVERALKVEAPEGHVWRALTEGEQLSAWFGAEAEIDPRPGGRYRLSWPRMKWHLRGTYTQFEPGRTLGFTWQWDHEPERPMRHVAVDLTPLPGGGTRVSVTHGFYGSSAADAEEREGHLDGWRHFLGRLAALPRTT